jgi:hypothetical protein
MELRERSDAFNFGGMMQEYMEHTERRIIELELKVGLRPDQFTEKENLRLAYLHVKEDMQYLRR